MLNGNYRDDESSFMPMTPSQVASKEKLIKAIEGGDYELKDVNCLCGNLSDDSIVLSLKDRYGIPHRVLLCRKCSLIYNSPRFTAESLSMFYEKAYRDVYGFASDTMDGYFNSQYEHGYRVFDAVASVVSTGGKSVLDIGCATGGILYRFHENGNRTVGIDMDERCLEYGRSKGLDLKNISLGDFISGNNEKFDIIIMSHVLEHCDNPVEEMKKIKGLLSEGGILFVEVPNIDPGTPAFHFLYHLQSAHLWYFDSATLAKAARTAGLKVDKLHDVRGEDLWMLLSRDGESDVPGSVKWEDAPSVIRKISILKMRAWRENIVSFIRKTGG